MSQIAQWLETLGMAEYAKRFVENRIDLSVLRDLTDQDLKDLGVVLGDRRKLLRAIRELGAPAPPADAAERRQLTLMSCDLVGQWPTCGRPARPATRPGICRSWHALMLNSVNSTMRGAASAKRLPRWQRPTNDGAKPTCIAVPARSSGWLAGRPAC
jgi:hypothetical protein